MVLHNLLLLLVREPEPSARLEAQDDYTPGVRSLTEATAHVVLRDGAVDVIADDVTPVAQKVPCEARVDLGVVPLALLAAASGDGTESGQRLVVGLSAPVTGGERHAHENLGITSQAERREEFSHGPRLSCSRPENT